MPVRDKPSGAHTITHDLGWSGTLVKSDDYPWGQTPEEFARLAQDLQEHWPSLEWLLGPGVGLGKDFDPVSLEAVLRYCRAAASPSAAAAYERMNADIDIRPILSAIHVPTLVMNRTGDPAVNVDAARDLATRIPNAQFVEFPGVSHMISDIEPERVLAEMEEFITGVRSTGVADRILATVLFVDIVGSTKRGVELGDAQWRDLLEAYYTMVRKQIARFRGREIDTAGDGFFATFDGPARAIQCAVAISDEVKQLNIQIRAGLHTGECELMGNNLGGIAVHIGARIISKAEPGEILVSRTVKDLVAGSGIEFEDNGSHVLKGVPGKWHLFRVKR